MTLKNDATEILQVISSGMTFASAGSDGELRLGQVAKHIAFAALHMWLASAADAFAHRDHDVLWNVVGSKISLRLRWLAQGRIESREVSIDFRLADEAILVTFYGPGIGIWAWPWVPPDTIDATSLKAAARLQIEEAISFLGGLINEPKPRTGLRR